MTSYANSSEHPFVAEGGIAPAGNSPADPFEALDDLMTVIEALCQIGSRSGKYSWPQGNFVYK